MKQAKVIDKHVRARRADSRDAEVGRRVRSRRLECRLSQTELADRIGVSLSSVSLWLRKARNAANEKSPDLFPAASRLVPVTIRSTDPSPFELVTASGVTLRIPPDFDPAALERLLPLLVDRC